MRAIRFAIAAERRVEIEIGYVPGAVGDAVADEADTNLNGGRRLEPEGRGDHPANR